MEKEPSGKIAIWVTEWLFKLLLVMVVSSSCGKDGGVCMSNSGPITRQIRNISGFSQVELNDNVSIILTKDTIGTVVVEAGRNLLGGIKTNVDNGSLIISNTNTCNWLRDYSKPINVYIPAGNFWRISYNGSGNISTADTVKQDSLTIEVWGGCGTIDLTVNIWKGNFSLNMGTVDFHLRGISAITAVYTSGYGLYDGKNLMTGYTYITCDGSNDCYVKAKNYLDATIGSIGNIYYTGDPAGMKETIRGEGKIIPF